MTTETTSCEHDFVPGAQAQNLEPWEGLFVFEAKCRKCGYVDPDQQIMPPEILARRQAKAQMTPAEFAAFLKREIAPGSIPTSY